MRKDQTDGSGGSLWETLRTVPMVQVCSGGRTRSDGPWLDFGAKVGFGAQLAYWRALLARVTCGRAHAHTCGHMCCGQPQHVGADRQFPTRV